MENNFKVFNATEAHKMSQEVVDTKELLVTFEKINETIDEGLFSAVIRRPLQDSTIESLKKAGYDVKEERLVPNKERFIIKW